MTVFVPEEIQLFSLNAVEALLSLIGIFKPFFFKYIILWEIAI